jgi:phosphoribosylamine--glycine ligase
LTDLAKGQLDLAKLRWKAGASVCVVLASGGYPGKFETGKRVEGLTDVEKIAGVKVLHAGTKRDAKSIVTGAGRVLGVTTTGPTLDAALLEAYQAIGKIRFDGMHYRKDIGVPAGRVQTAGD